MSQTQYVLQNCFCAARRLRSSCASSQADQSLRCPHEDALDSRLPSKCPMKILIRLRQCMADLCLIIVQVILYFLWDNWVHPGYFENRIPLKSSLGGVCSLANYSVAYLIKPSLRFSWFCVFFVSKDNPFWLLFRLAHMQSGRKCFAPAQIKVTYMFTRNKHYTNCHTNIRCLFGVYMFNHHENIPI